MLFQKALQVSSNEFQTNLEALKLGVRHDCRGFEAPRKLEIIDSDKPGSVCVKLGNTMITAMSTAKIVVPNENNPNKGFFSVCFQSSNPNIFPNTTTKTFQTYFQYIWRSSNIFEESALCMKPGEKVWRITTQIFIGDDDGGLLDASVIACYISLSQLRFPSFDTSSGLLYRPSQRRTHKIAFIIKPVCVTVGFFKGKILVDPTLVELHSCDGFSLFVFDEWLQQIFLDSHMPQNIEDARNIAMEVAKTWAAITNDAVNSFKPHLFSVGNESDFLGYEPHKTEIKVSKKATKTNEFEIWKGDLKSEFVLDFFDEENESEPTASESENNTKENWLLSSLRS
ncbi:exosome complex component RRP45 [Histomonas meleagridis]|uniref:exosome complex component RRP45 n=1 Tax=Histomonas meleagridis TaxID=135588 RepID=UPI00355A63C0|nr:exosome complex component RRP45 [Histomonas meleagridis]KAH0796997.1 exosome complex component RRP45 [Histomonas meleagridis]